MNFVQISSRLLQPRLPELGHIKIGGKGAPKTSSRGKTFRLPEKYDHFVVTRRDRDTKTENLVRDTAVHAKIGDRPVELDVRLLFDDPAVNWQAFLAAYDGRTKRCSGDGERAVDTQAGVIPCTCPWFKWHEGPYGGPRRELGRGAPTCKPHGRLSVILEAAETFGGFYVFRTTSWETIRSITASLQLFREQFGYLAGLPLRMRVYPATDTYEEGGQVKTSTSYKVALVLRGSFDTAKQIAKSAYEVREQLALPSPASAPAHQAALREEEERDAAEISAEFHPEAGAPDEVIVEADLEEDEEESYLEDLCRLTLEYADWDADRINRQIAKSSADLQALAEKLSAQLPTQYAKAVEDLAPGADAGPAEEEDAGDAGAELLDEDADEPEAVEDLPSPAPDDAEVVEEDLL